MSQSGPQRPRGDWGRALGQHQRHLKKNGPISLLHQGPEQQQQQPFGRKLQQQDNGNNAHPCTHVEYDLLVSGGITPSSHFYLVGLPTDSHEDCGQVLFHDHPMTGKEATMLGGGNTTDPQAVLDLVDHSFPLFDANNIALGDLIDAHNTAEPIEWRHWNTDVANNCGLFLLRMLDVLNVNVLNNDVADELGDYIVRALLQDGQYAPMVRDTTHYKNGSLLPGIDQNQQAVVSDEVLLEAVFQHTLETFRELR